MSVVGVVVYSLNKKFHLYSVKKKKIIFKTIKKQIFVSGNLISFVVIVESATAVRASLIRES